MQQRVCRLVALACAAWVGSGCVTSVSTLQRAQALDPGEVQVTVGMVASVNTSAVGAALDLADSATARLREAEAQGQPITPEVEQQATEAGLALLLFQPGVGLEFIGRVGVYEDIDVGLRYTGQLVKADAKWQLWEEGSQAAALNLGYAYHLDVGSTALGPALDLLDYFDVGTLSRHDLDLGALWGREWGEWLAVYAGGRYIASFIALDPTLQDVLTEADLPPTDASGVIHHLGATAGLFVGYKYIFVNLELNIMQIIYNPRILGVSRDLGGTLISPVLGLTLTF